MGTDSDTTYAYDGEGRRVRKVVGGSSGVATTYVYNVLGQLVAEFGGTAPDRPGTRYLTPDPLGSTRLVTAEDQSVLSRHDYLPFGEEIGTALRNRDAGLGGLGLHPLPHRRTYPEVYRQGTGQRDRARLLPGSLL